MGPCPFCFEAAREWNRERQTRREHPRIGDTLRDPKDVDRELRIIPQARVRSRRTGDTRAEPRHPEMRVIHERNDLALGQADAIRWFKADVSWRLRHSGGKSLDRIIVRGSRQPHISMGREVQRTGLITLTARNDRRQSRACERAKGPVFWKRQGLMLRLDRLTRLEAAARRRATTQHGRTGRESGLQYNRAEVRDLSATTRSHRTHASMGQACDRRPESRDFR